MNKIEKTIEYLFYLLVLLYFVGKVFKPITLVIDILFIYQLFKNKEFAIIFYEKYKSLIIAFCIFIGYLLFQSVFLELKYLTFKSSFETILYIILVFAALYNFTSEIKVKKLIYISYIILFFLALDSFYQYFTGFDFFGKESFGVGRLTAWSDRPNVSLMMGEFFGLLIVSIFIFEGKEKKIAIFMLIISLILIILAGNRSPLLALFSSIFFISLFSKKRKYIFAMLAIGAIFIGLSMFNPKLQTAYSKFTNLSSSSSTSGRYELFEVGAEMFKENKIIGIGSHNYKHFFREYFDKTEFSKYSQKNYIEHYSKTNPSHVHSVGLDILISYGILGTFILLYILYQIYKYFVKNNEIGLLASIGFLYCITPLQFARSFTMGDWQFITYLGLIFLVVISSYNKQIKNLN